ncbi:Pet191 N domain containing protein [Asbolus verrucosus]|uniref:Pet191 N domain containing protein n=1 Tax=Asbolus verrucosus TaxID=1661398 RepID=A0A482W942_ASBVE|nr:Pet191 N domain containing protein [Asbolus verrucosus]
MMRYQEENERLADKSACAGVRADLKMCLLESDCCKKVTFTNH